MSTIKDLNLAPSGERKIRWVEAHMPVLRDIGSDFAREKPFSGLKIALSVHLEAKTAYLCRDGLPVGRLPEFSFRGSVFDLLGGGFLGRTDGGPLGGDGWTLLEGTIDA